MVSLETNPIAEPALLPTVGERRLQAEWALLQQLVALNPARLAGAKKQDSQFEVTLLGTPALLLNGAVTQAAHRVRIAYPRFFPSVPLELYLAEPMLHPNIHPLTGFVCLWDRHRVSNTVEHALHKTVAMLGWRLLNAEPRHVMQPGAPALNANALADRLRVSPLAGVHYAAEHFQAPEHGMRRRLS